jgi:hypothetical protein
MPPVEFYTRNEHEPFDEPEEREPSVWETIASISVIVALLLTGAWLYHLARMAGW